MLEKCLAGICRIFFFLVWILQKTLEIAAKIIEFLLFLALVSFAASTIKDLSGGWQSLVLNLIIWTGAIFGISFFALAFWRPDKMSEIMRRYE